MKKRYFTLIELLVVIAVIGVLTTMVMVYYSSTRKKARDTQRINDMTTIVKALNSYKSEKGHYPNETPSGSMGYNNWEISIGDGANFMEYLESYLPKTPVDPLNRLAGAIDLSSRDKTFFYAYHHYDSTDPVYNHGCGFASSYAVLAFTTTEVNSNKFKERATCGTFADWGNEFDYSIILPE